MKRHRFLAAIVLLGAALRLCSVWFGLPHLRVRPDEETALFHAAAILEGDPNPHFFHWPSLLFYVLAGLFTLASWVHRVLFLEPAIGAAEQLILGRVMMALAGTVTIVAIFEVARRTADEITGLLAALFLAVAILHVRDSHFAMTDVMMTFFVTLSLACLLRALDRARASSARSSDAVWWFAAAGLAGGLATSSKYSAAAVGGAIAAAQLLLLIERPKDLLRWSAWAPTLVFVTAFGAGFLAGTPYALLDYRTFSADLVFDVVHLQGGHVLKPDRAWIYHLTRSLPYGSGVPIFAAAVVGVIPTVRHHWRGGLVVGAFAVPFFLSIGSGRTVFFRYALPLVPIVCVLAAVAVRHAGVWIATHARVPQLVATLVCAAAIGGPAFVNSLWLDYELARTDSRVLAGRWLMSRVKPEESLGEIGGAYTGIYLTGVSVHRWYYSEESHSFDDPDGRTPVWLVLKESPLWTYAGVPDEVRRLARDKYQLVHVVRATTGDASDRTGPAVYDLEDAFFLPVSGFASVERPGPTVSIYRRADAP